MNRQRKTALLGIGIALYVVLSTVVIIPIINRIKLDLGYIVFGVYLNTIPAVSSPWTFCFLSDHVSGNEAD